MYFNTMTIPLLAIIQAMQPVQLCTVYMLVAVGKYHKCLLERDRAPLPHDMGLIQ